MALIFAGLGIAVIVAGAWLWTPDKSRQQLELKYLKSKSDFVEVAGVTLHVRDSGQKTLPAVIFIHGLGSSLHTWEPWAQALADHFRVVRYDMPGAGLSGSDPADDYSDRRGIEVLARLMDRLGLEHASLVGNSIGGRLAWAFAAQYPKRVDKLVLISPDGFESPGFEYGKAPAVPGVVKLMRYALPKSFLRANLVPAYADPARLTPEAVDRYYDLLLAPGNRDAMLARMGQTVLVPPPPLLKRITVPTLLLWGDKDALIPISNAADYLKDIPNAKLVNLAGLGHVPHEEAPDVSLVPLRAFLEE